MMKLTVRKECSEVLEVYPSGKPKLVRHWTEKVKRNCLTIRKVDDSSDCCFVEADDGGRYEACKRDNPYCFPILQGNGVVYL